MNRKNVRSISLAVQSLFYVAAGINHFWHSRVYVAVMPDHYSHPYGLVLLSGAVEIVLGLGLMLKQTRRVSAFGLIGMLVVYFDVHVFMLGNPQRFPAIPFWVLEGRIPLQFLLIGWAANYVGKGSLAKPEVTPQEG